MNTAMKWIGGATLGVTLLLGAALFLGNPLDTQEVDPDSWIQPGDVLTEADAEDGTQVTLAAITTEPAHEPAQDLAPIPSVPEVAPSPAPAPTAPAAPLVIKRILPISGPIKYGEWHWDDEGVPDGPLIVTVDLEARVISVFQGGYEIGAAAALLGTPEHPTPVGTFPILTKERHNISEKYGNAPMPWTLRLTWDGVAIHGGSTVENGYASHGCIGVPDGFVARLFAIAKKGDRVIITNGQQASVGTSLTS